MAEQGGTHSLIKSNRTLPCIPSRIIHHFPEARIYQLTAHSIGRTITPTTVRSAIVRFVYLHRHGHRSTATTQPQRSKQSIGGSISTPRTRHLPMTMAIYCLSHPDYSLRRWKICIPSNIPTVIQHSVHLMDNGMRHRTTGVILGNRIMKTRKGMSTNIVSDTLQVIDS
jgi:hypothetical protein